MSRMRIGAPLTVAMTRSLKLARRRRCVPSCAATASSSAAGDVAAGHVGVLPHDGVAHGGDRNLVGGQPVGIDPDVDRALEPADDSTSPTPADALELHLDDLVGDLGQLAQRAVAGERRWSGPARSSLSNFAMTGGSISGGRSAEHRGDAVAHVLGGGVDVAVELERGDDERGALPGDRAQLVDALDGVDDLFDGLRDLGLDLFRRRARQRGADAKRWAGRPTESDRRPGESSPPRRRPPASTIIVAKTGRRIQISASFCINESLAPAGRRRGCRAAR